MEWLFKDKKKWEGGDDKRDKEIDLKMFVHLGQVYDGLSAWSICGQV